MKKIFGIVSLLILLSPIHAFAEERPSGEYGDYDTAIDMIQESMRDYYIRGENIQYNYSRAGYGSFSPEEATEQDNKHLVCASYTYSTYVEAFGVSNTEGFPIYNYSITDAGAAYYNENKNNPSKLDGTYLIYYEKKADNIKYIYDNKTSVSDFAQMIKPGDLFTYTGHAMIAYEVVERTPGNWDVLMLNSTGGSSMRSRINGTAQVFHHLYPSSYDSKGVISTEKEGSIKFFWLSENSNFVKNGVMSCKKDECTTIRMFYKGSNNKAIFNYPISTSKYNKSLLRLEYPGLLIEKNVNKTDNNSVYLNDELEYTISITNLSNSTQNSKNYSKFYIVETLEDTVQYVSSDGTKDGNKVVFTVNSLNAGQKLVLKYKVKVKEDFSNLGKVITANGELKSSLNATVSISTGKVENKIIPTTNKMNKSYSECYDENKNSKTGLDLINSVYICAYGKDFHFDEFQFSSFLKNNPITAKGKANAVTFQSSLSENYVTYKNMILNDIWGALVELSSNSSNDEDSGSELDDENQVEIYTLPRWSGNVSSTRARNINKDFFKEGDVLIYSVNYSNTTESLKHTKENGVYAFIYLNGKFVGINGTGDTSRNEFTYQYYTDKGLDIGTHLYSGYSKLTSANMDKELTDVNYSTLFDKDYYVILRPELVIKEVYSINVSKKPDKTKYLLNEDKLELSGGELTVVYNDGTSEIVSLENQYVDTSGFATNELGEKIITVGYGGGSTTFTVKVMESYTETVEVKDTDSKTFLIIPIIMLLIAGPLFITVKNKMKHN